MFVIIKKNIIICLNLLFVVFVFSIDCNSIRNVKYLLPHKTAGDKIDLKIQNTAIHGKYTIKSPYNPLFLMNDGNIIISKLNENNFFIWDTKKSFIYKIPIGKNEKIYSIGNNNNIGLLCLIGDDSKWYIKNINNLKLISEFDKTKSRMNDLGHLDKNGKFLYVYDENSRKIIWTVEKKMIYNGDKYLKFKKEELSKPKRKSNDLSNEFIFEEFDYYKKNNVLGIILSAKTDMELITNDEILYISQHKFHLGIWNLISEKIIHVFEASALNCLSISYNNKYIASGASGVWASYIYLHDDTIRIWDIETGTLVHHMKGHSDDVTSVVFNKNNTLLVSGSFDGTIKIWDLITGSLKQNIEAYPLKIYEVLFSNDETKVIAACLDGTVRIFDIATGKQIAALSLFEDGGWVVVSHDGRYDGDEKGFKHVYWEDWNKKIYLNQNKPENLTRGLVKEILYR